MKTKVVQHVPRVIFSVFKVFKFTFLVPSFCPTFRHFFEHNLVDFSEVILCVIIHNQVLTAECTELWTEDQFPLLQPAHLGYEKHVFLA